MSNQELAVVILAAGMGTRMKSTRPKVMHEVAHLPMINWVIKAAESLKPQKIIVVAGPDMPELVAASAPHEAVIQKDRNGTGGAVKTALPKLKGFKGDVLILLGDAPLVTTKTLKALVKAKAGDLLTGISVLGMRLEDPTGYGRLVLSKNGQLEKIVEHKDASAKERKIDIVNSGAFCVDGTKLARWVGKINNNNAQGEFYITDLPEIAAAEGIITKAHVTDDATEMMGCNSRGDLAAIEAIAQTRLRDAVMAAGVTMHDPASVYLSHDTKIGPDSVIEPHVVFAPGVSIGAGAYIKAFSHFEGTKTASSVSIGPFARLRPGSEIGEDARIGNFVEIKKSKIGAGSKIGHLAYVGDTKMGPDVNFSAGAITVNYDGFEKHETIIGKGVMVGSNVNLVAPLTIDDGAFIAAGSTITEDVPADALSITRDTHQIREGWAKEYRKRKAAIIKKLKSKKKAGQ